MNRVDRYVGLDCEQDNLLCMVERKADEVHENVVCKVHGFDFVRMVSVAIGMSPFWLAMCTFPSS